MPNPPIPTPGSRSPRLIAKAYIVWDGGKIIFLHPDGELPENGWWLRCDDREITPKRITRPQPGGVADGDESIPPPEDIVVDVPFRSSAKTKTVRFWFSEKQGGNEVIPNDSVEVLIVPVPLIRPEAIEQDGPIRVIARDVPAGGMWLHSDLKGLEPIPFGPGDTEFSIAAIPRPQRNKDFATFWPSFGNATTPDPGSTSAKKKVSVLVVLTPMEALWDLIRKDGDKHNDQTELARLHADWGERYEAWRKKWQLRNGKFNKGSRGWCPRSVERSAS